jgi:hypothetical protein
MVHRPRKGIDLEMKKAAKAAFFMLAGTTTWNEARL